VAPSDLSHRRALLSRLVGYDTDATIELPFSCDYGTNIHLGSRVYLNFNCIILDVAPVRIGHRTLLGPAVQVLTATHPLSAEQRREGWELGKAVCIGADVWIGGGAILCPGVSIGDRSVIGAGSIVTRDVPADVVVAGNPARVLRSLG
jgi:maltose O-acetyltransferase